MDKIKYVKLEQSDGSYSDNIPLAVDADYVDVNGNTLTNELNNKATKDEVQAVASGSPAGVYATVSALATADPDHSKIYVVSADGHWYYYANSQWNDGGPYQAAQIIDDSITTEKTTFIKNVKNLYNSSLFMANKFWSNPNTLSDGSNCYYMATPIKLKPNTTYYFKDINFYYNFCWLSNEAKTDYSKLTDIVSNNTFSTTSEKIYLYVTHQLLIDSNGLLIAEDDYSNILTKNDEYIFKNKEFYCGINKQFTTLKSAVEYANQFANATLYVDAGTYDLVQEYGESYLNSNNVKGLELKNGLKIIFTAKSKVIFHYTGSNSFIKREFSPFNTGANGGTLENCIIDCSNCRYCIHDERGFSKDSYKNTFKNCEFFIDNSNNPDWEYQEMSVAGGFGLNGVIEYNQCYFDKPGYYHQNADDNETQSRCEVYFINNYVKKGTFQVNPGHSSLPTSKFFACGNITKTAIPSTASDSNVASYLFNNSLL